MERFFLRNFCIHIFFLSCLEMSVKDTNISTHVLDTATGLPAGNLKVRLMKCAASEDDPRLLNPEEDLPFDEIGKPLYFLLLD